MENLKEIKLMMERLESPRMTDTEYQKRRNIIKEEGDGDMSQGVSSKTDKIVDLPAFAQLTKSLKSKAVDEQVEVFMTLLGQMDLKGNFGVRLKKAMQEKGLI